MGNIGLVPNRGAPERSGLIPQDRIFETFAECLAKLPELVEDVYGPDGKLHAGKEDPHAAVEASA